MDILKLYQNTAYYPDFSNSITLVKTIEEVSPRNIDTKTGFIDVQLSYAEVMNCNYCSIERAGKTIYAWITDVQEKSGDKLYTLKYSVDALRTYKNNLNYDRQYIVRHPNETDLFDSMLGSLNIVPTVTSTQLSMGDPDKRVFIVQHYVKDSTIIYSNVPLQPAPYIFYCVEFNPKRPLDTSAIELLMRQMGTGAKPENIVTMYSVPYFYIDGLPNAPTGMPVVQGLTTTFIAGWKYIPQDVAGYNIPNRLMNFTTINFPNTSKVSRRKHSLKLVFPDAGIMSVPDDYRFIPGIGVRQDVDLFSGSSNYLLASDGGNVVYDLSLRGSAINSVPIVADPGDSYLSQNQNSIVTTMMGDVATAAALGFSIGGPAGALGGAIGRGILSLGGAIGNISDIGNKQVNPPAFLGSALVASFNQKFWAVEVEWQTTNDSVVHSEFGYPYNMIATLTLPGSGYIQTRGCNIRSDGTVPLWAIQEINNLFDSGLKVI